MKKIETAQITDISQGIGEAIQREFGNGLIVPEQSIVSEQVLYEGMVPYPANPNILLVPTGQNMAELAARPGQVFGLLTDGQVRPAVVTARSTAECLDLTYLAPPDVRLHGSEADFDTINPLNPVVNPMWAMLLKQAAAVQDRRVGATHDPNASMGTEIGHSVLAATAIKRPEVLDVGHAVHGWTESGAGIAGAVTDTSIGLYDFKLSSGERRVGEHTATIQSTERTYLLQIPELNRAMEELESVSSADLTVGLGLVALQTQLETGTHTLQKRLIDTMARL